MDEIRDTISELEAVCIFSEPQFAPKTVSMIASAMKIRWGVLDPLGSDIPPGQELYFSLLTELADSFEQCLGKEN